MPHFTDLNYLFVQLFFEGGDIIVNGHGKKADHLKLGSCKANVSDVIRMMKCTFAFICFLFVNLTKNI